MGDAMYIATHVFVGVRAAGLHGAVEAVRTVAPKVELLAALFGVVVLLWVDVLRGAGSVRDRLRRWPLPARWAVYYGTALSIVVLGVHEKMAFIYFQF
jgi:hypothetical protein